MTAASPRRVCRARRRFGQRRCGRSRRPTCLLLRASCRDGPLPGRSVSLGLSFGLGGIGDLLLLFADGFALLARDRALRIVALLALGDAGGVEEAHHAVGRLRALDHPGLDLVHVELEALFLVLRQQRIVVAEALDEAAVARRTAVGGDDVIERPLLGSGAGHADDDWHWLVLSLSQSSVIPDAPKVRSGIQTQ